MYDADDTLTLDPAEIASYGKPRRRWPRILAAALLFAGGAAAGLAVSPETEPRAVPDEREASADELVILQGERDQAIAERDAAIAEREIAEGNREAAISELNTGPAAEPAPAAPAPAAPRVAPTQPRATTTQPRVQAPAPVAPAPQPKPDSGKGHKGGKGKG